MEFVFDFELRSIRRLELEIECTVARLYSFPVGNPEFILKKYLLNSL